MINSKTFCKVFFCNISLNVKAEKYVYFWLLGFVYNNYMYMHIGFLRLDLVNSTIYSPAAVKENVVFS